MFSPISSSPKSSSPIVSTKYFSLQIARNHLLCCVFRVCGWVLIYVVAELLFFYGWFIYAVVAELLPANLRKPSYKKCAFRGEKTNTFQKTPKSAFVRCIYLSFFVIWYPYLDNLNIFSDMSESEDWTRREWRRRKKVTDSAETTQKSSMKLVYMDEL